MPTYEYKCQDCGTVFEALRPMKDSDAPIDCKHCSSSNTVKKLTTFRVIGMADHSHTSSGSSGCGSCQGGSCSTCGY
jgi:putative FmdB family regulatory protein